MLRELLTVKPQIQRGQRTTDGDVETERELLAVKTQIQRLGGPEVGEDLFQDACLAVCSHQGGIDSAGRFAFAIARNRRIDILRREKVRQHYSLDFAEGRLAKQLIGDHDPCRAVEEQEERERMLAAVKGLKPKQREAIQAVYLHDEPDVEVAERLGIPRETLRTRCKQGLKELRRKLIEVLS
jgi:RNA polymerase sigma-70 factor (ECF subfamily)